jgi:hypothetical protein
MVDWQVTATTVFCEAVADEVTILVYPDWSVKCTGMTKYTSDREAGLNLIKRSLTLRKVLECKGADCPNITAYKEKLQYEETRKARHAGEMK